MASFAPEVTTISGGEEDWSGNALRFASAAAATAWVNDLRGRWLAVDKVRVVPSDDEPNR